MKPPKPSAATCPMCQSTYEHEWDGEEWVVDAEWWHTEVHPFLDSRSCWLKAEGYTYDREQQRWVRP